MITKFHRIRQERLNGERGFTLTELLVVIVIIGILVAIAIPVFLSQREAAFAKAAQSDVRNAIPAVETYYANKNAYPASGAQSGPGATTTVATLPTGLTINVSPDVTITYSLVTATGVAPSYTIQGKHDQLSGQTWTYDSKTSKTTHAP